MKSNKGITLTSLVITIIILIIIASISIASTIDLNATGEDIIQAELTVIQNAILQRYSKYTVTKNSSILVGDSVSALTESDWSSLGITDRTNYKQLSASSFSDLGISDYNTEYFYVVNYTNGDVIIKTQDGVLYSI